MGREGAGLPGEVLEVHLVRVRAEADEGPGTVTGVCAEVWDVA